ncbi:sterile alpha motif domain-containing protein 9-like [Engraulis encrasicolus]|uniref:sterile alpha motif domain-containing protein 9-like n=1 Tax=Engraulis encrasicolus TaxID=184585 RepID=UPI002FD5ACA1
MEEKDKLNIAKWTESDVSSWLRNIGVKEVYVKKLYDEEVDGHVLCGINEDYLTNKTGMKSGQVFLIISNRDKLMQSQKGTKLDQLKQPSPAAATETSDSQKAQSAKLLQQCPASAKETKDHKKDAGEILTGKIPPDEETEGQSTVPPVLKKDCKPRPFGKEGINFTYVKHNVLQPETGVLDLISPCHEYKSFETAATLERTRLQSKFANELLRFGTGCMNMRSNGTIHFGVMDSRGDTGYVHGEIIGIPVTEKDMYVDALDYIERCCSESEHVRRCIRPPQFIEVIDLTAEDRRYVVEVDVVPLVSIVRHKVYAVRLPKFNQSTNKITLEKDTTYCRVGASTKPVDDLGEFYRQLPERDALRETAESRPCATIPEACQDLGRKLTMLITGGRRYIDKGQWFILVTNRFGSEDMSNIDFLMNLNILCVFDFDPDSNVSGFCQEYQKRHAANLHFLKDYIVPSGMGIEEFQNQMHLFEQTSWIFCNGRNDFRGKYPSDDMTWFKTKKTQLKECVSLICKQILPKGTFTVVFLLTSPVEGPLLHTYSEFFADMGGHEDILCISESEENFEKWQSFAGGSFCDEDTVTHSSVVGMKMSHINATLQRIQSVASRTTKHLPTYVRGECLLEAREEERMSSLEILYMDHSDETTEDFIAAEKENIEQHFYLGGQVDWLNFWLAEKKHLGEVIQRDAYHDVFDLLSDCLKNNADQPHTQGLNIFHHPGSGGSTVARQVLWNSRRKLRCAVVKPSYSPITVSEHAHLLRKYEEKDISKCVPVLLLVEDRDDEFLDDLKFELEMASKKQRVLHGALCFIVLSCQRSYNPEKMCKESPLHNVQVTHKLSDEEKRQFASKRRMLEQQYKPEFILTFVLMSEGFDHQKIAEYVEHFVKNLLMGIDHTTVVTRLIHYVAMLNTYVQNSFLSQSHCEALLALPMYLEGSRTVQDEVREQFCRRVFEDTLTEPARLVLIHLRDERTHIKSIRMIHPLVAKEILQQLLRYQKKESDLALELLRDDVLFQHRFGREDYKRFLRALFMKRDRVSKGDEADSFFSPLVEHVRDTESATKAIDLLTEAYKRFDKDPLFAQHLARLYCSEEKFEDAERWAETAARKLPSHPFVLHTKGQVYRKWFQAKVTAMKKQRKTAENLVDAITTAVKAMDCFQDAQRAAVGDAESMSYSGFFAAVEVGCGLLKLFFTSCVFSDKEECERYLLTDYIPEEVRKPWDSLHIKLKSLQSVIHKSLEWVSEDLTFFQTDTSTDEEDLEDPLKDPKKWLMSNSVRYGKYFSGPDDRTTSNLPTPLMVRMKIHQLGGGNMTTIFSLMTWQNRKDQVKTLENIISLYKLLKGKMDQIDTINYIMTNIALGCLSCQSKALASLRELQDLSQRFVNNKQKCQSKALFLRTLLFWPEDHESEEEKEEKYDLILSAVRHLSKCYHDKMKDISSRRRKISTLFFLGSGNGLDKIVHKSRVGSATASQPVSEKKIRWYHGEGWKMPEIAKHLKRVSGWTENGKVYLDGPQRSEFTVLAHNIASVPHSNENVTFYLGFTMRGPMAYNVTVTKR